ncbi:hypothetical protein [Mucilaginibacter lacusdianchii]|uniref:hypothetical protein n=1 Tax=Mucilaginibacter lacusdianchii TaxID=2684211 RepID=UPI00131DADA1|nr:hypothetical protein [Mucilaginibacter sp. JXJ CY 39]
MMTKYFISIPKHSALQDGTTIHDPDTKLKVGVFNVLKSKFKPRRGEKCFYVTAGNQTLAFETQGYKKHRKLLILQMVAWYCVYLGLMEAQIHSHLPIAC